MTGRTPCAVAAAVVLFLSAAAPRVAVAGPGDLDTSFDVDGRVVTPFTTPDGPPWNTGREFARAMAIQADGKIVAAGECWVNAYDLYFCLARYNVDGSLDTSFGSGGKVTTFMNNGAASIAALAIQDDQKIVAAGTCGVNGDFCLARYNVNGGLDSSFGGADTGGAEPDPPGTVLHIDFGSGTGDGTGGQSSDNAYAVAIQGDGKIVIVGQCDPGQLGQGGSFCAARVTSNGTLDTAGFGGAAPDLPGTVVTDFTDVLAAGSEGGAVAVFAQGTSILVAGNCSAYLSVPQNCFVKYTSTGALDPSFGGGTGKTNFYNGTYVTSAALHGGGILLAGHCQFYQPSVYTHFCLARYSSGGSPDTTFGNTVSPTDNVADTDMGSTDAYIYAVAVTGDQSIVAAGMCLFTQYEFCLALYGASGTGNATPVFTSFGTDGEQANAVAIQDDGRIVAAGWCHSTTALEDFCLARYGDAPIPALVTSAIHAGAHEVVTAVSAGTTIHDSVTVAPTGDPSGTVTISWFANGLCALPAAASSAPLTVSSGAIDATTFPQTPSTAGFYAFRAHYSGDGAYVAADGPCEPLTVTAAPLTDLVTNGTFATGTTGWKLFATPDISSIQWNVTNGVFQYYRVPPAAGTTNQAVIFNETGVPVVAHAPMVARFDLGNSTAARKRISVLILDANFSDLSVCTFWIPAGQQLTTYTMKTHSTQAWANAAIYFYAASAGSDGGYYQLDNVSLQYAPSESAEQTVCVDPTAPTPPGGASGPNLLTNGDFATGQLAPWGLYGQIASQISSGVFEFYRPAGTPAGVVLQNTSQAMTANEILTANFQLGNSSGVRKRVTVLVHDSNFLDLSACTFYLVPGQSLSNYALRTFATKAWTNATISVYPATVGTDQWIRLDNVSLQRTPGATITGTECAEVSLSSP